jgi:hypothetical protein
MVILNEQLMIQFLTHFRMSFFIILKPYFDFFGHFLNIILKLNITTLMINFIAPRIIMTVFYIME